MASIIHFRDYAGDCKYAETLATKLELALPKEILDNPFVKAEVKLLNLTTWQYSLDGETREGTFYWNDGEKAWKYYERTELLGILEENGCDEEAAILNDYIQNTEDDDFPKFSNEEEDWEELDIYAF